MTMIMIISKISNSIITIVIRISVIIMITLILIIIILLLAVIILNNKSHKSHKIYITKVTVKLVLMVLLTVTRIVGNSSNKNNDDNNISIITAANNNNNDDNDNCGGSDYDNKKPAQSDLRVRSATLQLFEPQKGFSQQPTSSARVLGSTAASQYRPLTKRACTLVKKMYKPCTNLPKIELQIQILRSPNPSASFQVQ